MYSDLAVVAWVTDQKQGVIGHVARLEELYVAGEHRKEVPRLAGRDEDLVWAYVDEALFDVVVELVLYQRYLARGRIGGWFEGVRLPLVFVAVGFFVVHGVLYNDMVGRGEAEDGA